MQGAIVLLAALLCGISASPMPTMIDDPSQEGILEDDYDYDIFQTGTYLNDDRDNSDDDADDTYVDTSDAIVLNSKYVNRLERQNDIFDDSGIYNNLDDYDDEYLIDNFNPKTNYENDNKFNLNSNVNTNDDDADIVTDIFNFYDDIGSSLDDIFAKDNTRFKRQIDDSNLYFDVNDRDERQIDYFNDNSEGYNVDSDYGNDRYKRQVNFLNDNSENSDVNSDNENDYFNDNSENSDVDSDYENDRYKRQVNYLNENSENSDVTSDDENDYFNDNSEVYDVNSDYENDRYKRQANYLNDNSENSDTGRYKRHINFYEDTYHRGELAQLYLHSGACINMLYFNDKISSLNTHDECVLLYEHENCQGRHLLVMPGHGCHFNLEECDFNDMVTSVRPC